MTGEQDDTGWARAALIGGDRFPALDGLRALAVAAVVVFHLGRLPGGNLGVDAFFVLSGWLITTRLLRSADCSRRGDLDLTGFWAARARRLLPASLAVLAVVSMLWTVAGIDVPSLHRDVAWALAWSSNWGTITRGGDYWSRFGEPSPVTHFWSLAVEEQFYLAWPLLLLPLVRLGGRRRDLLVGAVGSLLAAASVAFMVATFDPSQPTVAYLHTLARGHSLLIGAAAAALTASPSRRVGVRRAALVGLSPAAAVVVLFVARSDEHSRWLFAWGFPTFALAMAVVVVALADPDAGSWLRARPMRWVGERSYGIYLWHWPVILFLRSERVPFDGVALDVLRVAAAVTLAAVSYEWLEMPIRRGEVAGRRLAIAGIGAAVAVAVILVVTLPTPGRGSESVAVSAVRLPALAALPAEQLTPRAGTSAAAVPAQKAGSVSLSSLPSNVPAAIEIARTAPAGPVRVLVAGDSTALRLADGLLAYASAHRNEIVAGSAAYGGCGLSAADDGRLHTFTTAGGTSGLEDLRGCVQGWRSVIDRVSSDERIDVVLVSIGPWDGTDIVLPDGRTVSVLDDVGRTLVAGAYRRFVDEVEAAGARIVWVTPPDIHLAWRGVTSLLDDPGRWQALRGIVSGLPVAQVDLPRWLVQMGLEGPEGRPDGVHLNRDANERFLADEIVPQLLRFGRSPVATRVASPAG